MATANIPVTRVVVMEDRAQVERKGSVTLDAGLTRVEVSGLPLVAVDRSLKVEVQGATLIDAKLVRRWREKPTGGLPADASDLRRRVEALRLEIEKASDEVSRLEARAELLGATRGDLLRGISEGAGAGKSEPPKWTDQLELLSKRQAEVDEALRRARREATRLQRRHAEAEGALSTAEEKERDLEGALALTLEGQGTATVRASYLVPCAVWRPAYRASLKGDAVLLEAEAVVWQRTGEAWKDVQLQLSTARPTLGTTPPALVEDRLALRAKQEVERRVVDVAIREEVIQSAGETGGEAELPGLDDGGEARLLSAPGAATIPSDGQPHRVPLFHFEAKALLERVCPSELSGLVTVLSRFPNTSGQVLLAGPVDLIRQAGFVGRAQLKFAAPGETVKLAFGSEDGVSVVREVHDKVEEARLTGRRTTTKKVRLHVSNARPEPAKLVIEERVPVSEVKEVEVQVLTKECSPAPSAVTKDGIARIELELPPNGTKTAVFAWELSAAAKVAGI
ncbi:MAG: mucoidy inhibitor MuiA family protein [Myxococcales bacterium]|nr:mucoidy inhibitor MuiA family protein [Myxococcales bacterium]